ncbi:molybdotransferase-like divisome protein Glp [Actinomadura madurae]|uniref:molybdotransferase-like divisome protein Glp n=1 Tax=Actinomadura madurae TaxID=1993 RepID=UPI0020D25BC9|nr:gephyrin-like molybdotransferase Glp [Actinomadura madurae]MCP9982670.1 molybdopterin molybdotransferase MoeA [Actinomadura madurae]MCQ0005783.1 molybdopterin molybdotransferase MoeA [Actinomadura madurae]MCQ0018910.1 molybdopterin molybdotransferase MoeA [Actinomadura madurae]
MRTVDEHLAEILGSVTALPRLDLALLEAQGAVLAEPVTAPVPLPPFDNSAMDGYAVVAADIAAATGADPVALPVVGDIVAGDSGVAAIRPGLTARIMTGAPLPAGADAVVPVEWTDGGNATVRISRSAPSGNYIRRAGEDVVAGQVVADAGIRLTAPQIGMIAAVGRARVTVRPKPRIVVVATGDELREPGSGSLAPGQIWESNSFMLTAAVVEAGGVGYRQATVEDEPAKVLEMLHDQLVRADAVVTTGGVSMGTRDVVKEVLAGTGTVGFHKVRMRPGKPQGFGLLEGTPVFTLPGNPVSAYVSFQVFVRPALLAMQGLPPEPLPTVRAVLAEDVASPAGLRHFVRGRLTYEQGYIVTAAETQGSHQLASLSSANALIVLPEDAEVVPAGSHVEVMRLPS